MKLYHLTHPAMQFLTQIPAKAGPVLCQVPSAVFHQPRRTRRVFLRGLTALFALGFTVQVHAQGNDVENAPEVAGFRGQVTGTVKSTQPDKPNFVLAISKAEVAAERSTLMDGTPLLGKELTLGVRMPKNAAGVGAPHPDDIAYVKTLKPGLVITVKIFSVHNNPRVLRIEGPGQPGKGS